MTLHAISFGPDGKLYGIAPGNTVRAIDLVTGIPTPVSTIALGPSGLDLSLGTGEIVAVSGGALFRPVDLLAGTYDPFVLMRYEDGTLPGLQFQAVAWKPGGGLVGTGFRFASTETIQCTFDYETNRFERNGEPPGEVGSAVEEETGYRYYFTETGQILFVVDASGGFLGVFAPTHPMVAETVEIPSASLLFDIDPDTGVISNVQELTGRLPQALVYTPEPTTALLVLAGLAVLTVRPVRTTDRGDGHGAGAFSTHRRGSKPSAAWENEFPR